MPGWRKQACGLIRKPWSSARQIKCLTSATAQLQLFSSVMSENHCWLFINSERCTSLGALPPMNLIANQVCSQIIHFKKLAYLKENRKEIYKRGLQIPVSNLKGERRCGEKVILNFWGQLQRSRYHLHRLFFSSLWHWHFWKVFIYAKIQDGLGYMVIMCPVNFTLGQTQKSLYFISFTWQRKERENNNK